MNDAIRAEEDFDPITKRRDFRVLFQDSGHVPKGLVIPPHRLDIEFNRLRLSRDQERWLLKQPRFDSGVQAEPLSGVLTLARYPDGMFVEQHIAADYNPQLRVFIPKDRRPRSVEAYDLLSEREEKVLRPTVIVGQLRRRLMLMALQFGRTLAVYGQGELWLDCLVVGRNEDAQLYVCGVSRTQPARIARG